MVEKQHMDWNNCLYFFDVKESFSEDVQQPRGLPVPAIPLRQLPCFTVCEPLDSWDRRPPSLQLHDQYGNRRHDWHRLWSCFWLSHSGKSGTIVHIFFLLHSCNPYHDTPTTVLHNKDYIHPPFLSQVPFYLIWGNLSDNTMCFPVSFFWGCLLCLLY